MVNVRKVNGKRDALEFVKLPLRLYKSCPYFAPPLFGDELKLIKNGGDPTSESVFFLAERDGKTVGRIQGIIQKQYNEIHNTAQVRFTRFDSIDDSEVARALFDAVEAWGKEHKMTELVGPLGYNDLDREGLLVEGFCENSTFEEQYNYEYYPALVEGCGLVRDVDWLEHEIKAPARRNEMLSRVAKRTLELNRLHVADFNMPKKKYIEKYRDGFFDCLDECYRDIYGTVPITKAAQDDLISQFMLILNNKYLVFVCDENERVVAFALCFPAIGDAVKKSGGRLTLPTLVRILKAVKSPKTIDLGLVAVRPEYQNAGINAVFLDGMVDFLMSGEVERCETNLNLETNAPVLAQWKHFTTRQHKRRRSYIKKIGE